MNKILIFIPTYNERNNIDEILNRIIDLKLETDILFIDDNSPDGTGVYLNQLKKKYNFLKVLHREKKLGIGSAHRMGIQYAYDSKYNFLITLDCDMTHKPSYILNFFEKINDCEIVIGTRHIDKSSLETWSISRKFLTKLGYFATKTFLNMKYDATGGFRLYNLRKISNSFNTKFKSNSYSWSFESLYILHLNNYKILEVPINMPSRVLGNSKMKIADIFRALYVLFKLKLITIFFKSSLMIDKDY